MRGTELFMWVFGLSWLLRFHISRFFFFLHVNSNFTWVHCTGDKNHYSCTVYHCSHSIHVLKNIKNGSYGTIYTFKNYFTTVLSVFSFQFSVISNNKLNPNGPYVSIGNTKVAFGLRFWAAFQRLCFPSSFFFFFNWEQCFHIGCCLSVGPMHCAWTHYLFDQQILHWNMSVNGSHALFMRPTNLFFHTKFH